MKILALEIGATRLSVGPVGEDVDPDDYRRIPVPAEDVWDECRDLLLDYAGGDEVAAVGIASAGPIDLAAGVIAPNDIPEWRTGFGIVEQVRKMFPAASVALALDGACLALAERNFGATVQATDALSIYVSDRIVAGVMVGGLVVVGKTGNTGHFGHMMVQGFGDSCECGNLGCLEAVAGEAAMVRWARAQGWPGASAEELLANSAAGDAVAIEALERAGTALGRAIVSAAALLDVELAVIGGPAIQAGSVLWRALQSAVTSHARLGFLMGLRVLPSQLRDVGILAGAGVLAATVSG
ncbi:ROK family protein [Nocardia vaccinii]|uniref:ROK family protein n=1 Tax=Nocardia vaccinii TaxID=1822 RepID=UPI0008340C8E|nr:ROK family protein [Nocardia vaccinii]